MTRSSLELGLRAPAEEARLPVSAAETIAAYDQLADEYDLETHETTRGLEQASLRGFASAMPLIELCSQATVLELGCGSGLLTRELISLSNAGQIVASDPSQRMLGVAANKLCRTSRNGQSVRLTRATAREALLRSPRNELIVASLADPFLEASIPSEVATRLMLGAYTFFSVPSRAWATEERAGRLHIHHATTRFRTSAGRECRAKSQTYDSNELTVLFESVGLEILACGRERSVGLPRGPMPEVAWVLARRSSLKDPKMSCEIGDDGEELHERVD